jgi:GNAT superfamily N-acetyltransferase
VTDRPEIRALEAGDRAQWDRLWTAYLAFYKTTRPREIFDLTFARYLDPDRTDMRAWIAHDGRARRGPCHVILHAHGWQDAPVTYLQDLYADPEVRGKGVGRALIETVYDDADRRAARTSTGRPRPAMLPRGGFTTASRWPPIS